MIRALIWLVVLVLVSVTLALLAQKDPGYVMLAWGQTSVEAPLSLMVLIGLLSAVSVYFIWRLMMAVWHLPDQVHGWRGKRQRQRATQSFLEGLTALVEGRWTQAEKKLIKNAKASPAPLLNYLGAARAAQQQGALDRRDQYLHEAHRAQPHSPAVQLAQAELSYEARQKERALATLNQVHETQADNPRVLRLLARLYADLQEWQALHTLLPQLKAKAAMPAADRERLALRAYDGLLHQAAEQQDLDKLQMVWAGLPESATQNEALFAEYVRLLRVVGGDAEAEALVRKCLKELWQENLVHLYGLLQGADPAQQLKVAEGWLKEHGRDPILNLTLGRLCLRNRLWGKARIYLETSLSISERAETYKELGLLLEHLQDDKAAAECFRKAAILAIDSPHYEYPDDLSAEDTAAQA